MTTRNFALALRIVIVLACIFLTKRADGATAPLSLRDVAPIDAHAHVFAANTQASARIRAMLDRFDLRFVNITVIDPYERGYGTLPPQISGALAVAEAQRGRAPWVTTFDPKDFEQAGFADRVIKDLDNGFRQGAVGVKIYKTIGMYFRAKDGRYVMPDDPAFAAIFEAIAARGKTVYAHIAEPIGAWRPYSADDPDSSYYRDNPGWLMYGHPERPSKETILAARDRMLAAHPKLRVVGCHLGSMEEDVDQIARRLDTYPNFAVDTAARVTHLALQPRDKVRAFLIKYQDRVLYGTDDGMLPDDNIAARVKQWEADLQRDWKFFATDEPVRYMNKTVKGLALPEPVLRKLYHENAVKWVPGVLGRH